MNSHRLAALRGRPARLWLERIDLYSTTWQNGLRQCCLGSKILNLQTRVRFPVALPLLLQSLTSSPNNAFYRDCGQFCGHLLHRLAHLLISPLDGLADSHQVRMVVDARGIDRLMSHRIHHRQQIFALASVEKRWRAQRERQIQEFSPAAWLEPLFGNLAIRDMA